ncbi:hypothetical protein KTD31_01585 [Burkholderia multivorans]|uniref:hypothetical protein n=1 Tax=Burkholderia multivorans TaxID=87883 RepID=UPI001C247811|nr:hypothetical protein [Burkholderia multivorans]MBU9200094.1 hypothetical protein [Burkholderia multivorans]MDN8078784.1 hypothetical protein [Burkholderia multivorans]
MKKLTADINLDHEVAHLAKFISQKWTPIENLHALFTEIRDAALHAARGWLDQHELWAATRDMEKARQELLMQALGPKDGDAVEYYDALCTLLNSVGSSATEIRAAGLVLDGPWDYERRVKAVLASLTERYPALAVARPLGWEALEKGYRDFDGMEAYDPSIDHELFEGTLVEGPGAPDFTGRVALPYVMYDEVCQGRKASYVLVGAVYSHFLGIAEFLNTHRVMQDLATAFPQLHEPVMLYERKVTTNNPFLKVAVALARPAPTKEEFEENLANKAAFEALSDEEKAQRKADNSKRILRLLDALKSSSSADDLKYAEEKQRCLVFLRAELNGQA